MKHLLSPLDLSVTELEDLLNLARDISKDPKKYSHVCDGKKLATLFYEPSTRTRLSFEVLNGVLANLQKPLLALDAKARITSTDGRCVAKII